LQNKNLKKEEVESNIYFATSVKANSDLSNENFIHNNDIIVKKFSLINTGDFPIKVFPKMTYNDKFFKIFNCFCGSEVIVKPNLVKDIYIYFQIKANKKELENRNTTLNDLTITVSI